MPRSTSTSSTASDGAASSSAAGDEEDGATKPRRLPTELYQQLRDLKRSFSQDMYAMAVAHLEDPLEKIKTEGKGDCWLLTIMASFEVKGRNNVKSLRPFAMTSAKPSAPSGAAPSSSGLLTRRRTAASGCSARCAADLWTSTTRTR